MADDPTPDSKLTEPAPDPAPDPKPDDDPIKPEDDWQAKARKHERDLKKERKERERIEQELKDRQDADKSDQEKAIEKARKEAREEALTEAQKDRRADQLEIAVTRLATKGVPIRGSDELGKFADSEDALVNIERAIARDEISADDIFDSEGKVNTDALETALGELLQRKPHLAADDGDGRRPSPGDGGARTPVPPKDLDDKIREAEEKGDVRTSIALKNQKLRAVRQQGQRV